MATNTTQSIPGPPYPPTVQALGETPSIIPDVPICAVFLFLFFFGGAAHMTILQFNEKKFHKKFPLNGSTFGFCLTRVGATAFRIAWATNPTSIPLGLVSTIFFYAGVVLLFIANLFFAQRIVRAQHPQLGWTWPFKLAMPTFIAVTVATIICLITAIVVQFYTLDEARRQACRDVLLYGATFYAFMAFVPIPLVIFSSLARLNPNIRGRTPVDKFGGGSMRGKVAICLLSGVLLALGSIFRCVTDYLPPVPIFADDGQPVPAPWYLSKASFYAFNFAVEAFIVWLWAITRIDKRFIVPNGAARPYSYAGGLIFAGEAGNEKRNVGKGDSSHSLVATYNFPASRRNSWTASRKSLANQSRVSWGGISREDIRAGLAEDGIEFTPYVPLDRQSIHAGSVRDGVEQEMGWDPKKGKWALRPVSDAHLSRSDDSEH